MQINQIPSELFIGGLGQFSSLHQSLINGRLSTNKKEHLLAHFSKFGVVSSLRLISRGGKFRGIAYLRFASSKSTEDCLQVSHKIENVELTVSAAMTKKGLKKAQKTEVSKTVFLINLHREINENTLQKYFQKWGQIENVRIRKNLKRKGPRAFIGFVTFRDAECAINAVTFEKDHYINGYLVYCKIAVCAEDLKKIKENVEYHEENRFEAEEEIKEVIEEQDTDDSNSKLSNSNNFRSIQIDEEIGSDLELESQSSSQSVDSIQEDISEEEESNIIEVFRELSGNNDPFTAPYRFLTFESLTKPAESDCMNQTTEVKSNPVDLPYKDTQEKSRSTNITSYNPFRARKDRFNFFEALSASKKESQATNSRLRISSSVYENSLSRAQFRTEMIPKREPKGLTLLLDEGEEEEKYN